MANIYQALSNTQSLDDMMNTARLRVAIKNGNAVVGADPKLPASIRAMNEDEAFEALMHIDSIANIRTLTKAEFLRMTQLELRLEQFTPQEELDAVADLEVRQAAGEFDAADDAAEEAIERGDMPAAQEVPGFTLKEHGYRYAMPLVILALALGINKVRKGNRR